MTRVLPDSLVGQLLSLIVGAFLAATAISFWFFADERGAAIRAARYGEAIERTVAVARVVEGASDVDHDVILAATNSRAARFVIAERPSVAADGSSSSAFAESLPRSVDGGRELRAEEVPISPHDGRRVDPPAPLSWLNARMRAAGVAPVELRLSTPLKSGRWLDAVFTYDRPGIQAPPAMLGAAALSLVLILIAIWAGLHRITGPLRRLALAADDFGLDGPHPDLPSSGPREVRALSEALERMHTRLVAMISDRTRMLAALGHDLRSPITALRVRAEMVDDDETRERMIASLDEMRDMVEATLAFARGVSADQPAEVVDLADVLADLAEELSVAGPPIVWRPAGPLLVSVRRTPLRRALRNILENAQRYGGGARVSVERGSETLTIRVDDDGPGIPSGDLERVFDPFTRLETSRSRETGGIGLGLPIARAILRAHGGEVMLGPRPDAPGLRATVTLPLTRTTTT